MERFTKYWEVILLPSDLIKSKADEHDMSEDEVKDIWKDAKNQVKDQYDYTEEDDEFWELVNSIFHNMLGESYFNRRVESMKKKSRRRIRNKRSRLNEQRRRKRGRRIRKLKERRYLREADELEYRAQSYWTDIEGYVFKEVMRIMEEGWDIAIETVVDVDRAWSEREIDELMEEKADKFSRRYNMPFEDVFKMLEEGFEIAVDTYGRELGRPEGA